MELYPTEYFNHSYNQTIKNERCIEIPLSLKWMDDDDDDNDKDIIEIGAVLPYYGYVNHPVIDPYDSKATIKEDAEDFDYTGKNVLAISTLEHLGVIEYGNTVEDSDKPLRVLNKIIDEAESFFITVPVGFNHSFDSQLIFNMPRFNWFGYAKKSNKPLWVKEDTIKLFEDYEYNKPFKYANAVMFITNRSVYNGR